MVAEWWHDSYFRRDTLEIMLVQTIDVPFARQMRDTRDALIEAIGEEHARPISWTDISVVLHAALADAMVIYSGDRDVAIVAGALYPHLRVEHH